MPSSRRSLPHPAALSHRSELKQSCQLALNSLLGIKVQGILTAWVDGKQWAGLELRSFQLQRRLHSRICAVRSPGAAILLRQGSGGRKGVGAEGWPSLLLDLGAGSTGTLSLWQSTELPT